MINYWQMTDEVYAKINELVVPFLSKINALTDDDEYDEDDVTIDLTKSGINPYQLRKYLEENGYEHTDSDQNGWEIDFWLYMKHKDKPMLVIGGCGMTFELHLSMYT